MNDDAARVLEGQAEVVDAVLAASRLFVAVASRAVAGTRPEVTLPQFRTLVLLDQHDTMTVGGLAADLGVVPSTATRMCDRLVAKGLIERATDETNRRRVSLRLSVSGRRLLAESTRKRKQQVTRLLQAIPHSEQRLLAESLSTLVAAAAR